uniref:Uncharacterized protein n=1 Tax=Vitis vinifera TaxID=29760 RepID=F6GYC8_VITVI
MESSFEGSGQSFWMACTEWDPKTEN